MIRSLLRLNTFLRPYYGRILINMLVLISITGLSLAVPFIIQQVIDIGLADGQVSILIMAALALFSLGLINAGLAFAERYLSEWVAAHIGYDLRNRMYNHIQRLSFSYHDHAQAGQLISRTIEDVRAIERFAGTGVIELVRLVMLLGGIVVLLFLYQPGLAWIALLPMIPLVMITSDFGQRITTLFLAVDNSLGELSSRLQESISGIQVVKAFAREPHEIKRFDEGNRTLYKARVTVIGEWSKVMPTTHLLVTLGTILILWFGGQMVLAGEMSVGELVAFNGYLLMLSMPAQQLTWLVNAGGEAAAGAQRIFDVLDTEPEIASPPDAPGIQRLRGQVTFKDVEFAYQGETTAALHDIDVDVQPDQIVALVGPTGSGKTSLINLIPRFYDVNRGAVLIDGMDLRQLDLLGLRQQIGLVLQTSLLFSVSVRENIAYGRPDASLEEVIAAAKAAQAHEFIERLSEGYDTIVGERGITLSGGQRQRVAIARALLMDPRILILDDSTSSVDTQTERLIQQALATLMAGRTTFVIAHRLSTVRRADLILVLDHGRIVERGTHTALLEQGGLYRQIYELQLRDQESLLDDGEVLAPVSEVKRQATSSKERFG